jgi:hypothetical protein
MRSFLSVASLMGTVSASVVVSMPTRVVPDDAVTCPLSPTPQMDLFYSQFIVSDTYLDSARSGLLPENCLGILFHHFGSPLEDLEVNAPIIEDALVGRNCTISQDELDQLYSNPRYGRRRPQFEIDDGKSVRLDDFIASRDVFDRLESMLGLDPKPYPPSSDINLQLYYLHTDLTQRSACPNLESRVFRKLIEQLHYQLTIAVVDNTQVAALAPVIKFLHQNVEQLERGAESLAHPPRPMFMMAPIVLLVAPIVAEVGCWCLGRCIRYYRDRTSTTTTTTTTTTTPSTIAAWIIEGQRRQMEQFIAIANSDLDEIMIKIGTVSGTDYEREIGALRSTFVMKIMAITKGMVANGGSSFDPTSTLESSFRITELLSKSHEISEWQSVRTEILSMVSKLRSELFSIRTSTF